MKALSRLALIAAALLLSSCLPLSVNPIFSGEDELVAEPRLLKSWQDEDGVVWAFETQPESKAYLLRIRDKDERVATFIAMLGNIGDRRYLDLQPIEQKPDIEMNHWLGVHLIAGHSFMRVDVLNDDTLVLRVTSPEKLGKLLNEQPGLTPHVVRDKAWPPVVLTGSSAQVKGFIDTHVTDELMTEKPYELKAMAAPATQPAE